MKYLLISIIIIALFLPFSVLAGFLSGPIVPCGRQGQDPCTLCHIFELAKNVIQFLFEFILIIAPVFVLIGGVVILSSVGKPEQAGLGRKIITSAIVGVVIALLAWTILGMVFNALVGGEGFPWPWNEFRCEEKKEKISSEHYETLVDADGNGEISPGDTIRYSFTYTNNASEILSNLVIISDYDQSHIFSTINISNQGMDDSDKITWNIGNLDVNQPVIVSYDFILAKDFSDLLNLGENQEINPLSFRKLTKTIKSTVIVLAKTNNNQTVYLDNIITISSNEFKKKTANHPIVVIVLTTQTVLGDPEDIPGNPVYLAGYYEEPDDSSSKWSSYDWYFDQVTNNGANAIRLAFYNPDNPFYSISPWVNNNCAYPNDSFYADWLKPIINKANSKGIYVVLTLYFHGQMVFQYHH